MKEVNKNMFHNVEDVDIDSSKTAADIGFKVWGKSHSTDISTYHKPTDFISSCQRTETEFKSFVTYSEKEDSVTQVPQYQVEGQRLSRDNLNLSIGCLPEQGVIQ